MISKIIKKNLFLIVIMFIFIILCLIIKCNYFNNIIKLDNILKINVYNGIIVFVMKIFTNIASTVGVIIIFVVSMLIFKNKYVRITILSNIIFISLLSSFLKVLFSRSRPLNSVINMPISYSFPSGHTFFAVGFFGLITYFIFRSRINKYIKSVLISAFFISIIMIMISRIYLRVHYFTDVIGGLILGILVLLMSINTYKVLKEEHS